MQPPGIGTEIVLVRVVVVPYFARLVPGVGTHQFSGDVIQLGLEIDQFVVGIKTVVQPEVGGAQIVLAVADVVIVRLVVDRVGP